MFDQIASVITPKVEEIARQELKMYKFKNTIGPVEEDETESVIAVSLGDAIRQRPHFLKMFIHSITK